ncbi:MAG: hypothetical protein AAB706_00820, partial [Patescibacteria group bacterium]
MVKELKLYNIPIPPETLTQEDVSVMVGSQIRNFSQPSVLQSGFYQSANFVSGSTGWQLTPSSAEFNVSTAINSLDIPDTTTASSFHVDSSGNTWWGANVASGLANANASVTSAGAAVFKSVTLSTSVAISGIANSTATDISLLGWQHDLTFSSTDFDTAAWTSGTITLSSGRTFSISAGNTGNMVALTYIYLSTADSLTVLQTTTTASTAIGANKILVAVAQNNSDSTAKVWLQVYGGKGGIFLGVDNLAANSASTNEFIANTANIKDLIVTNAKVNDLAVSKLTAGSITSKAITLAISDTTGDVKIQAGKTDFGDDTAGFILGMDDSDSNNPKFEIGSATEYLKYDPTNGLRVLGISQITKSFTSGEPLAVGNAVFIEDSGVDVDRITIAHTVNDVNEFGSGLTVEKVAQSFVVPNGGMLLSKINFNYGLWKVGTPTDNVILTIYADSGGAPVGASQGSVTIAGSTLSAVADTAYEFTFATGLELANGTFWFVLSRSGAMDGVNYYRFNHQASGSGDQYASGSYSRYISGSWTNINFDIGC